MKVSEIFYSLQGEGFLAGTPSAFIRLAGCPLRCRWCDSKYAWEKTSAKELSIEDIIQTIQPFPTQFAVVTGGEPMVTPQLPELLNALKACKKHITIETAGISFTPHLPCDLMSISPKLANSSPDDPLSSQVHDKIRLRRDALRKLIAGYHYQLKFVVDSPADIEEINKLLKQLGNVPREKVMLMPQASTRENFITASQMVADLCERTGFAFSPRLHILLWNGRPGH